MTSSSPSSISALLTNILQHNLQFSPEKLVVIVTDVQKSAAAQHWLDAANSLASADSPQAQLVILENMTHSGLEPAAEIVTLCESADLTILHTHYSLTHTQAGKAAIKKNGIGASLPGVTLEMMERTLAADYQAIFDRGQQLKSILENGTTLTITSDSGTNLTAAIRTDHVINDGGLLGAGMLGNLPAGEVFFAPLLGSVQGTWVIEASLADEPDLDEPITLGVANGEVIEISGGQAAKRLQQKLDKIGRLAFTVAELGIGTNPTTNPYGEMIEAEKTLGTAHLAMGNSSAIGGEIDVPIHLDALTLNPTITVDGQVVMQAGLFKG